MKKETLEQAHVTRVGAERAAAEREGPHDGTVACCAHHDLKIEREIAFYLIGGVLLIAARLAKWFDFAPENVADVPAAIAAAVLLIPMAKAAWTELRRARPGSSTLVVMAVLGAMVMGRYESAGWLAFILVIADQWVRGTASGAQRAIEDLVGLTPDMARIVIDGAEKEVGLQEVKVGQIVRVRPGENLPVDGKVVRGQTSINQASLTGEAIPHAVEAGEPVYAGTTNLTGQIDLEVTSVGEDTTIGKVTQLIREAESSRSPRQALIEQVASYFVPIALSVAFIVWFVKSQSEAPGAREDAVLHALTVLVVTCPAALLLSSPSAMVAAFAAAARLGILIKKTTFLEAAAHINTVVMDKTGTLTTGTFEVTRLVPSEGVDGADLLKAAAGGEQKSNHPLAQSIMRTAEKAKVQLDEPDSFEEVHGQGVRARFGEGELLVGRANWLKKLHPQVTKSIEAVESKTEGITGVHVMRNGEYLGLVGLEDKVRRNARGMIQRLRDLGVRHIAIFTGDRLSVAKRVGVAVGVDAIEAECLPEEKHEEIEALVKQGYRVMMVGDGINDGPSLAAADVGVAMGLGGSDIAANSAGVALMNDDLSRIPFLIELSRKTRVIIIQNVIASIIIVLVGLVLAATGSLDLTWAALYHFAGDIFVIANSFRLFRFGDQFAHLESEQPERRVRRREASLRGLAGAQPA
jgi:Cd2+/Zn2+-exporting ATPase